MRKSTRKTQNKKRACTTAPTKVAPMRDSYAMPAAQNHKVTSPGK